jgi:hypothetical protein
VTGTTAELRAVRARWRTLAPAAAALEALGFPVQAAAVAVICNTLGSVSFAVPLPRMLCQTPTPVSVTIGDPHNAEPGAVICGTCTAKTGCGRDPGPTAQPAGPGTHADGRQDPAPGSAPPAARPAGPEGHTCLSCGCQIAEGLPETKVPARRGRPSYRHTNSTDCADALRVPQPNKALIGTYQAHPAFRWGADRQGPQPPHPIHS